MAVAYQSFQSSGWTTSSAVVTKPTSLAVGDMMLSVYAISSSSNGVTAPAGWNLASSAFNNGSGSSGMTTYFGWKIADSADVAATNFTFTIGGGGGGNIYAAILRFTGTHDSAPISDSGLANSNDTLSPTMSGITPTVNNILVAVIHASAIGAPTFSGYSVATDNPTWTEIVDTNTAAGEDSAIGIAYSTVRSQGTATGTLSITSTVNTMAQTLGVIGVRPPASALTSDITETVTLTESVASQQALNVTIAETATLTESASAKNAFSNNVKSASSWSNVDKS